MSISQNGNVDKVLTPETRNFLSHLWRGGAWGNFWFASHDGMKFTQWTPTNTIPEPLPRWKTANAYMSVNPSNVRGTDSQRGKIETVSAVNTLYAEFDAKDFDDKGAIIAHLEKLPLPPSVLIDSGGGYHAYWLISDGYRLTDDATRQHAQRVQRAWVEYVGGDPNATDIARVLRLPGTRNLKPQYGPDYPQIRYVECCLNRTNKREELEGLIAPLLKPKPATATPVAHRHSAPGNGANHRGDAYAATALDGELDELARTPEGNRNAQLNTAAFNLGLLVADGLLNESDIADQLVATAVAIGLGEREATATVRSGIDAGMRSPRRNLPDFTDSQQRPMMVAPVAAPDNEQPVEQQARRFQFLTPTELLNRPPRQWLVYPLLGVGDTGMIFGESGAGKTFVTIDLLLSCALGQRFADNFEVDVPIRVAYCAGEGTGGLAERFRAAMAAREVDPALLERNLTACLDVPNLFDPGDGLYQFAADYIASGREKLHLLVIDTLHAATAGSNENSTQDAGKILASIRFLQKTLGCSVLLVHHANKSGTGERGSTAFRAAMDAIIEVSGNRDAAVMKCSKLKDGTPFEPIAFSLVVKESSARVFWEGQPKTPETGKPAQDEISTFLASQEGKRFTVNRLMDVVAKGRTGTNNILKKLADRGQIQREMQTDGSFVYWYERPRGL